MVILTTGVAHKAVIFAILFVIAAPCSDFPAPQELDRDQALSEVQTDVKARRFDQALRIVTQLAKQDPRDFEARNWVARLKSWKGSFREAERLYRAVLSDHAGDVEAEIGLADVLGWQKRFPEAIEILKSLETREPNNLEFLSRLGRLYYWQHDKTDARRYFNHVLQIDPNNKEAKNTLRALEGETPFHLETGYLYEGYNFISSTQGIETQLVYRDYDRKTLLAGFQFQNKFGQNDSLFTVGGTYRARKQTYLRSEFTVAPKSQSVVPHGDYTGEVMQGFAHGVALGGAFRYLTFSAGNVQIPSAQMDWNLKSKLHFNFRYTPTGTKFTGRPGRVWNQGGWAKVAWDTNRFFSPYAMFGMGAESFALPSSEQLGFFHAHTYGAGAEVRFSPKQGMHLGYFYQARSQGQVEDWVGVSYFVNF